MRKILLVLAAFGFVLSLVISGLSGRSEEATPLERLLANRPEELPPSADHTMFAQLQQSFATPQEVTAACISCHTERHKEVMTSSHWNWERLEYIEGQGIRSVGKKNILNNFCVGISGNEQTCNRCHIGYGYGDDDFDFENANSVDCLACHDNSGGYLKANGGAGMPDPSVDLSYVAQRVGSPKRDNCGVCHFFGGGGNNVKHGDLEVALLEPSRELDVHMAIDGADMQCVECHSATKHQMLGKLYSVSSMNHDRVECASCHTELPHGADVLNKHTYKVACQTCHIPAYAKEHPTKLYWDWSTAGKLKDGQPFAVDSADVHVYTSQKGSFIWGKDVAPEYVFFNGRASHYLIGDKFDPRDTLQINSLLGSYADPTAKIYPVKVHRTKQVYDRNYHYLIQPKTVSTEAGDGGFWKEFDWQRACEEGMKEVGLPYSGEYGFANTEMYWPVNHMVAPKEESLSCVDCHTRDGGRLAGLEGFYMPGRDRHLFVERAGAALMLFTLAGVALHSAARLIARRRKGVSK